MLINLLVPTKDFDSLKSIYDISWRSTSERYRLNMFMVIEGSEEDYISLILKYGTERVWIR